MPTSLPKAALEVPTVHASRAKALSRRTLRSSVHHLRWRERIANLVAQTLGHPERVKWAAASDVDPSTMESFACEALADRKTVRVVDVLFMPRSERQAFLAAIEGWATGIERGEL